MDSRSISLYVTFEIGYNKQEVDKALPPKKLKDKYGIELEIQKDYVAAGLGMEAISFVVIISVILGQVSSTLVSEMTKDMYGWIKKKIINVLAKKNAPEGTISVNLEDVSILAFFFSPDQLLMFWKQLDEIIDELKQKGYVSGSTIHMQFCDDTNKYAISDITC